VLGKATTKLRELLAEDGCLVAPGCYDGFSGRLVQEAGFPVTYFSMAGYHYSQLGLPHLGVANMTEFLDHARKIATAIDIPLIIDAEHGFGTAFDIRRMVREFEKAGVAGLHIHDQVRGQGWMVRSDNVMADLMPVEAMARKIEAAKEAQTDPDFVIIGRTESTRVSSEEAVKRCNAYLAAGADLAMPMASPWLYYGRPSPAPREELHELLRGWVNDIKGPIVVHSPFGIDFTEEELTGLGVAALVSPQACLGYAAAGARSALAAFKAGTLATHNETSPHLSLGGFGEVVNQPSYTDIAQRYNV
jgi:2-methylisocitrate lyase-like PEP mutase family enzyme